MHEARVACYFFLSGVMSFLMPFLEIGIYCIQIDWTCSVSAADEGLENSPRATSEFTKRRQRKLKRVLPFGVVFFSVLFLCLFRQWGISF